MFRLALLLYSYLTIMMIFISRYGMCREIYRCTSAPTSRATSSTCTNKSRQVKARGLSLQSRQPTIFVRQTPSPERYIHGDGCNEQYAQCDHRIDDCIRACVPTSHRILSLTASQSQDCPDMPHHPLPII